MNKLSKNILIIITIVAVACILFVSTCLFILEEGFQAIVQRFGKIEHVYTEAGLKMKFPWDTAKFYSKKILTWDGRSERIPTEQSEAQFINVDTTARWRITDLVEFYERLGDRDEALKKLDDIIDSSVRTIISNNLLLEAVRSTRTPLEFSIKDFKDVRSLAANILQGEKEQVIQITTSAQSGSGTGSDGSGKSSSNIPYSYVSRYIYTEYLDNNLKAVMMSLRNATILTAVQENALVPLFNKLLADPLLYNPERFTGINLIAHAKTLSQIAERTPEQTKVLNRLLLEAAYPQNIIESPVKKGRETLSFEMLTLARNTMLQKDAETGAVVYDKNGKPVNQFGIELIDIIIRQIKYSDDLKESVYQRMIKERNQIAERIRSEGVGAKSKLEGQTINDVAAIESKAKQEVERIKGEADAEATRIYAAAYEKNREFFKFWRSLESYKTLLPKFNKTLSTDADYFDYLYNQTGR